MLSVAVTTPPRTAAWRTRRDRRSSRLRLSKYFLLEAEFLAMPTKMAASDGQVFAYTGRGHLAFRFPFGPGRRFEPFVLPGGGAIAARPDPGLPLKTETLGPSTPASACASTCTAGWAARRWSHGVGAEVRTPTFTQDYEVLAAPMSALASRPISLSRQSRPTSTTMACPMPKIAARRKPA